MSDKEELERLLKEYNKKSYDPNSCIEAEIEENRYDIGSIYGTLIPIIIRLLEKNKDGE